MNISLAYGERSRAAARVRTDVATRTRIGSWTAGLVLLVTLLAATNSCPERVVAAAWQDEAGTLPVVVNPEASPQEPASATPITSPPAGEPAQAEDSEAPPKPTGEPSPPAPIIAYVGAELRTGDELGTLPSGVLLVQGGKILAVGDASLAIPAEAERVDLSGSIVTPGLIDAQSELWLGDPATDGGASDASLNVVDGIDPFSEDWHEVVRQGITAVYLQPSRRGTLGGYGAVVSVVPTDDGQPLVLAENVALQASFGIGANNNRARQQQVERTKRVLDTAAEYAKKWKEYNDYQAKQLANQKPDTPEKDKATGDKPTGDKKEQSTPDKPLPDKPQPDKPAPDKPADVKPTDDKTNGDKTNGDKATGEKGAAEKPPKKPDMDPIQERLVKVLEGKIPLRVEVHTADDVAFLKQLLDDEKYQKLQVIFSGLSDLRSATESIRTANNPLLLGPWLSVEPLAAAATQTTATWGEKFADYAGAVVLVSGGSRSRSSRLLRAHAAKAIASGFTPERALKAITIDAARTLGVAADIGSLAPGKRADFVSFAGEPLDPSTPIKMVVTHGTVAYQAAETAANLATPLTSADLPVQLPVRYSLHSSRLLIDGALQPGGMLVDGGKIVQLVKADAPVDGQQPAYQLGAAVLVPGLVSAQANLGLTRLIDPQELPDASFVVAADALAELSQQQSLLDSGLLRVLLSPGSSNPVAGSASLIRIGAAEPIAKREAALKLVLTANARNPNRFPSSLAGQQQFLRQSLAGALLDSRVYLPEVVEQNLVSRRQTVWQSLVNGQYMTMIEAESDAEITAALNLIEAYKLKAAISGMRQLAPFIERIKSLGVTLAIQPTAPETYQWFADDLSRAAQAGIPIVFTGESAEQLRLTAAMSGLPASVALLGLCDAPMIWWGAEPAFSQGAPADFVIWSDSPVNMAAIPLHVVVDGRRVAGTSALKKDQ